jgi:hypothetical protein
MTEWIEKTVNIPEAIQVKIFILAMFIIGVTIIQLPGIMIILAKGNLG